MSTICQRLSQPLETHRAAAELKLQASGTQIYEGKAEMQGNKQISWVVIERRNETKARSGEGA